MFRIVVVVGSVLSIALVAIFLMMDRDGWTHAQSPPVQPRENRTDLTIVAFGDSLTQGHVLPEMEAYPAQLEARLSSEGQAIKVMNAGINGETSSGALSRVKWILNLKPDIVILETGANDGFRGIKPDLIEKNISDIIRLLKGNGVTVVLAGMQMLSNMGVEYTRDFRAIYPRVAREHDVILIPFFLEGVAGEPDLNLPDGIHPTATGHRMVADHVFPFVMEAIRRARSSAEVTR
jgi:acyl-CoA thioesterase I